MPSTPDQPQQPVAADSIPAAAPSRAKLTKDDEQRYAATYKKNWRTLRRWIEAGEKRGDSCPLHDPRLMPGWWSRCMHQRVPHEVEAAAAEATIAGSGAGIRAAATAAPGAAVPPPAAMGTAPVAKSIDIDGFDPDEGDRLRELKQIQAAKFHQLREAMLRGEDTSVLETKYTKLCDTIDRMETRVTERLKKRGLYRLAADIDNDLAQTAELMRQIDASQERRILERCPSLSTEQRAEVAEAVRLSNRAKESLLARLSTSSGDDLLRDLAA